jgi:hypothetical protein
MTALRDAGQAIVAIRRGRSCRSSKVQIVRVLMS